jgi:nitroreductase/dihydropteridine reductase
MGFINIAKSRYTTKKYDANKKINDEQIQQLKEILRLSPSSINSQPWKFIFVSDGKTKCELANASSDTNAQRINNASHLVVFNVIDNIEMFEEQLKQHLPEGSFNWYSQFVKPKGEHGVKSWLQHQVYLSLGFFLSACASMSIDCTPMEGIINSEYDKILQLRDYKSLFAVAVGYRSSDDSNQPIFNPKFRLPLPDVIKSI